MDIENAPTSDDTQTNNWSKRTKLALAAAALVIVGATGAFAVGATRPSVEMAPLSPVSIRTLAASTNVITVKGQVAEVYGNKFILADGGAKTLVDTGGAGEYAVLVKTGQPVTVQGHFRRGYVEASFLIGPDGKVITLHPMGGMRGHGGPDGDDRGQHGRHGPRGENMMPQIAVPVAKPAPGTAPAQPTAAPAPVPVPAATPAR